jgi:hypothetical protein
VNDVNHRLQKPQLNRSRCTWSVRGIAYTNLRNMPCMTPFLAFKAAGRLRCRYPRTRDSPRTSRVPLRGIAEGCSVGRQRFAGEGRHAREARTQYALEVGVRLASMRPSGRAQSESEDPVAVGTPSISASTSRSRSIEPAISTCFLSSTMKFVSIAWLTMASAPEFCFDR